MPENSKMKAVRRISVTEPFQVSPNTPVPEVPKGGARVKVHYAGVCYTEKQVAKSGHRRPRMKSISDTSLYPGYEVSGVIEAICNTIDDSAFKVGNKVIVFPEDEGCDEEGYSEFIIVRDVNNLLRIPDTMSMEVAAMLPTGALTALAAVTRTKPFVDQKIREREETNGDPVSILIVGAGALGLWTITLGRYLNKDVDRSKVHIVVADTNIEKLMIAKDHGCSDVAHWEDSTHEEHIIDRTKCVCHGGVDVIIDFVSSPRTINRSMKVLAKEGVLVVGGNSRYEIPFCLKSLSEKKQSVLGVGKGTRQQLKDLVDLVGTGEVKPPVHHIFPLEDANTVINQLDNFKIHGRALFQVCALDSDDLA